MNVWQPKGRSERLMGLIGIKEMPFEVGAWFPSCRWVHTFFMQFSIDCVGVREDGTVAQVIENVRPAKFVRFATDTSGVLELRGGNASKLGLHPGIRINLILSNSRSDLLMLS